MAYDIGPSIGITGEAEFKAAMAGINNEFKLLGSEMKLAVSQFDKNDKSTAALTAQNQVLGKEIDSQKGKIALLTTQYDKQNTTLATLKDKLDATKLAFGADSAEVAKAQKEYDKQNKAVMDLQTQLNNATTGLNNMNRQLESNNKSIKDNSKNMGEFGEKVKAMGAAIGVGMAAVGAAFVGAVVAGVKMSDDLTKALNGLQASTGVADEMMGGMKDTMLAIYNDNFGANFEEIGAAMATVNQQTGLAGDALRKVTEDGLALNDTFGFEVNESIRSANQLMQQFGLTGDEAYNLIAQGAQWGLDKNGDLLDSINEYSVQFKGLGFNATEMFNMLQNGAAGGAFSVDKLGDAVKEFGIRAKDGSTSTAGAFKSLGLDVNQTSSEFAKGGESGKAAFAKVNTALLEMKDPLLQNQVGTALWGSMWEDLGITGVKALTNTEGEITNTLDALGKINEVKYNSFGESIEGIKRQLLTGIVLPLGEEVLPKMNEFGNYLKQDMPAIVEGIKPVINGLLDSFKFLASNLNIIVPVLASLAAGFAAFKAITAIASTVSLFSGVIATLTTGAVAATPVVGLLAGAFTLLTGPVGLAAAVIALAVGGVSLLVKHFREDAIPATDLFGTTTSDSTKKAVQGYVDLDDKATKSLMSLKLSGQTVSKETADVLVKNFEDMGSQIKTGMDKHYGEDLKVMQDFFTNSSVLSATEEVAALAAMTKNNADKKQSVDDSEKQIKEILTTASNEKRALTSEEQTKINEIQTTMKTNAVKALSDTELESKSILERMKTQAGNITAQQAADVVKNSVEQKNKAIANANEQYDETVKEIIKQRDETGSISKEQADKLILEASRQKDETVSSATKMNNEVVAQAKLQAKDHVDQVDWTTGQVKSKWQVMADNTSQKMSDIGKDIATKWEEIKKDTSQKVDDIKTGAVNAFNNLGKSVEETWDGIKLSIKESINSIIGTINGFIGSINSIKISVPTVVIPLVGTFGGYDIGMPQIPKIPPLATGTNYVPADMLAFLHKGEAVVPAKYNQEKTGNKIEQTNNFYSPTALTPSETARLNKNAMRELALSF